MTDYDATAHITEEINEPEVKAPWAISLAMLFTYIAGFLFNIVLCFCMGDPAESWRALSSSQLLRSSSTVSAKLVESSSLSVDSSSSSLSALQPW